MKEVPSTSSQAPILSPDSFVPIEHPKEDNVVATQKSNA